MMDLGTNLPLDGTVYDPGAVKAYAQAAEALGYSYVLVPDHVLAPDMTQRDGPGRGYTTEMNVIHECFVLMGYLAGCTKTIAIGAGVLVTPLRQAALIAKQAAEVDVLSGGRLRLGIGVGWNEPEFVSMGEDFHTRGARAEEQLAVMNALWTQEVVTFHGRWHHIQEAGINPLPVQRPIPLWVGGNASPVLRRAATLGSAWLPERRPLEELQSMFQRFNGYLKDAGRSPAQVPAYGRVGLGNPNPDEWVQSAKVWSDLGAAGVSATTNAAKCSSIDEHIALIRRFKEVMS